MERQPGRTSCEWPALTCVLLFLLSACQESFLHDAPMPSLSLCGDGIVQEGEECDDGRLNSDEAVDACRTDCLDAHCGDGVLDSDEQCDDGNAVEDDGCNNSCHALYWTWSSKDALAYPRVFGRAIALDSEGNILIAVNRNSSTPGYPGASVVVKLSANGRYISKREFPYYSRIDAIVVDEADNIYVTFFNGLAGLVKLNPEMADEWVVNATQIIYVRSRLHDLVVGPDGNIFVAGRLPAEDTGDEKHWMAKYSPAGNQVWAEWFDAGGRAWATGTGIALGASGRVIAAGTVMIDNDRPEAVMVTRGQEYGEIIGSPLLPWSQGISKGHDVATDGERVVLIGNADDDTVAFGPEDQAAWSGRLRSMSGATHQWTKTINHEDSSVDVGWEVALHQGFSIAAGMYWGASNGVWLNKYDPSGGEVWSRSFEGNVVYDPAVAVRLVVDDAGNSYFVSTVHDDDESGVHLQVHKVAP